MSPRHQSARPWRARLAAAVALLVTGAMAAACSSAVSEAKSGDGAAQEGGILRVGTAQDLVPPATYTNSSDSTNLLIGAVYDTLIDYPLDSLEPQPALAESWEFNQDGTELTLRLRDDVTFHTGRPFTSKDVQFSIETWADPAWTVQLQRTAAAVTGFDTSDEHAITLELAHPVSNIFDLLDMLPMIDSESIDDVKAGKGWVGTGPYVFESWAPGSKLTFTRNEDYWGDAPRLDGIEVSIIPDGQAQVSQLRAGQLDMITGASNRDAESLGEDDRFTVNRWEGAESQVYVGANVENKSLSDVRVRQAIAYALDRERVVDEVFRGAGEAVNLPWPEYSPAYDAAANETFAYDPEAARKLVQDVEADKGELPPLPLTYPAGQGNMEAVAQIVQASLEEVGIEVELEPLEQAQVVQLLIGAEFEGLWLLSHAYAQYNPSTLAVSAYPFNADHNASRYLDAGYKKAADGAWQKKPDEVTEEDYAALSQALLDGLFLIEIGIYYPQSVTSSSVGGVGSTKRNEPLLGDAYLTE